MIFSPPCLTDLPAHGLVPGEHCDILPGGGVPVRVVVPLLRTLVPSPVTVRVLPSVDGAAVAHAVSGLDDLISCE